ncbi:hypothetical protein MKQ68_02900 [Chitinophaga horti]|uniref:Glycoside hydrolase family 65 n=1 Tax=Chitinophaga horti TaxID=2920382 RepID=A0ABY6J301_9BACT|nr:hypothetical protein [Chitinophaga horti]UYQ94038.1 hypothetical protein MKQ68_02900 [Chitinophaga horti]
MRTTLLILCTCSFLAASAQRINREALVRRHNVRLTEADTLASLTVGNGNFAFTADVTGFQSFPDEYANGVPLGTQSVWGWHSYPNTEQYRFDETLREYKLEGRTIPYAVQIKEPERNRKAVDYFRVNPHRLQLGNVALVILKADGSRAGISDIKNINQQLDMWTGELRSAFTVEGQPVQVSTYGHQQHDAVSFKVTSPLLALQRLQIQVQVPNPNGQFKDVGNTFASPKHQVELSTKATSADLKVTLDTSIYHITLGWKQSAALQMENNKLFLRPGNVPQFECTAMFSPAGSDVVPAYVQSEQSSRAGWKAFWQSGGAVDLSGSKDKRANELERRIILSQYLTKLQCSGPYPPQETGLTYNSWYGKPHLEMHWWHAVHFALWGRPELMERSLDWYFKAAPLAKAQAQRQHFDGLRWQKMVDHEGNESPSSVGSFLIWQQPHFIYMAELLYRHKPGKAVLDKYKELLYATADFMASYPAYDANKKHYILGRGLIPAQECFDAMSTFNPTYELAYWHWALDVAQQWRVRDGLPRHPKWDEVMQKLAPLPQQNGVYLATESTPDCYTNERYLADHPAVLGAYSTIPAAHGLDTTVMRNTLQLVWKIWKWDDTWGWDFPLTAMTAARLHEPAKAIDALLMPIRTNTYLKNGHNYQDGRLTIYLPGNGGLLSAIAMMCAGVDADKGTNIGFPKDGSWKVKWEGLKKMF